MAFIDGTAVNVALPALQSSLGASTAQLQWVIESYTLFLGALLLTGGSLGDLFGQARVFCFGTCGFILGSVLCAVAPSPIFLILARGFQGIGGSLLVPTSLALLGVTYKGPGLAKAIGVWSGMTSVAAAAGPLVGGFLAERASWRWVFIINVPVALAALAILFFAREACSGQREAHVSVDWTGSFLATVGLGGIVYGLIQQTPSAWILGVLAMAAFLIVERRARRPMLPMSLFRSTDFTGSGILTFLLYGALSGAMFFLPLDLVQVQGYSESAAGLALLPFVVMLAALSRWSASLLSHISARVVLTAGPILSGVGFALLAVPGIGGGYWVTFFPGIAVLGLGMAATVAPLTTTVMESAGQDRAGIASGVNNALSRVAGLISIAVFGLVLAQTFSTSLDRSLIRLGVPRSQWAGIDRSKLAAAPASGKARLAIEGAFVDGFRSVMIQCAGLAAAGGACVFLMLGRRRVQA